MQRLWITLALVAIPAMAGPAFAQEAADQAEHHRKPPMSAADKAAWDAMTPEQREAKKAEMRAKREANMSPEQKARMEARKKAWDAMTPEQREAKKAEMRERRGNRRRRD